MRKRVHESLGLPPEFHEDGPPEFAPLPDEFNRGQQPMPTGDERKRKSRLRRMMLLLAVCGLAILGVVIFMIFSFAGGSKKTQGKGTALTDMIDYDKRSLFWYFSGLQKSTPPFVLLPRQIPILSPSEYVPFELPQFFDSLRRRNAAFFFPDSRGVYRLFIFSML